MQLVIYILLCLAVGFAGRNRSVGFVGFFFIAFLLTPIIAIAILLLAVERKHPSPSS